jgi:hypothetical protein
VLVALTWIPGLGGVVLGLAPLRLWGIVCSYSGLTWALPGLLLYFLVDRSAKANRIVLHRPLALINAAFATLVLLIGAATVIGR